MLQGARRTLDLLLGRRSAFPAPPTPQPDTAKALTAGLGAWLAHAPSRYARIFIHGKPLFVQRRERELFALLTEQGLVERIGPSVVQPCVRLFSLYGRFIATDLLSRQEPDQVFSLMFEQVYFVRNFDVRPGDDVLELCVGSGVNSLFAADAASSVTALDINPRALAFARFNQALGPATRPLELLEGSLFEPVPAGRQFDTVLVNPPFELVPEDETWFLHSDGGEDGLDIVRQLLADLPTYLAADGRFQIITWSPATPEGPLLVDLIREALPGHRLSVHLLDAAPLKDHLRPFHKSPHYDAFLASLTARGITEVYFVYIHTAPSAAPGVEIVTPSAEIEAAHSIADAWL
jgi:hypothetical protein